MRRETYHISKNQGLKIQQVDGHNVERRALGDITNVRQPTNAIPGTSGTHGIYNSKVSVPLIYEVRILTTHVELDELNETKENPQRTEEDRKRDHRNALRRASYRRKKELALEEDKLRAINLSGKNQVF